MEKVRTDTIACCFFNDFRTPAGARPGVTVRSSVSAGNVRSKGLAMVAEYLLTCDV